MSDQKTTRPKARVPRGFRDRGAAEIAAERACLDTIRRVFESWGFEALETPAFEYTEALGKFLPDLDRPNEGVFSLQDEDGQWLSLRYDLTAPLARYVAENFQHLPKPFRRYQVGSVWRNEKPGPGRYREFTQFDADTVGSASPAADAELLMMVCDVLDALGLARNEYVVKVNSRKLLNGLLESIGRAAPVADNQRLAILRVVDKLDRLGADSVYQLLTDGRKDESGDYTQGVGLNRPQADTVMRYLGFSTTVLSPGQITYQFDRHQLELEGSNGSRIEQLRRNVEFGPTGVRGLDDLMGIASIVDGAGYGDRVQVDQTVVRGLEYYTGAVFEAQLTFPVNNEAGEEIVFGSVAGGGRYDDLVARFTGERVPATGISIGVSRLLTALRQRRAVSLPPLMLVLALDKEDRARSFAAAAELRAAGLRAETYVGEAGMKAQLKYSDRRNAAVAIIEGSDERARGEVTIKDLVMGAELAKSVESRAAWVEGRPAQVTVPRAELVAKIRELLERTPR